MEKLQNGFTTPEQSKRLLELGVPANSADCYLDISNDRRGMLAINEIYEIDVPNIICKNGSPKYLPCWSVGRLMEIFDICFPESDTACWPPYYELDTDYITYVVRLYERGIMELDFSKLEDYA